MKAYRKTAKSFRRPIGRDSRQEPLEPGRLPASLRDVVGGRAGPGRHRQAALGVAEQLEGRVLLSDARGGSGDRGGNLVSFEGDPDDQITEAANTEPGLTFNGQINPGTDVDMYRIQVDAGERLSFDIDRPAASSLDPYLRLFDAGGGQVAFSDDNAAPGEASGVESYIDRTFAAGGAFFIGVSGFNNSSYNANTGGLDVAAGSTGDYSLVITDLDADDQIVEATSVAVGSTQVGAVSFRRDVDMFRITVGAGQRVGFDIDRPDVDLDSFLRLFDAAGTPLASSDDDPAPGEPPTAESYIEHTFTAAGTHYVGVSGFGNPSYSSTTGQGGGFGDTGAYSLILLDVDPDDQIAEAVPVVIGGPGAAGQVGTGTDVDMYRVTVATGDQLVFDIDRPDIALDSWMRLFDATGQQIAVNDDGPTPGEPIGFESYLEHTFAAAGDYYVGVSGTPNSNYSAVTGQGDANGDTGGYSLIVARRSVRLVFQARGAATGRELYSFDGTAAALAADLAAGTDNSSPANFTLYDGKLFFTASDAAAGQELWSYDGTTARRVADIRPGPTGSSPSSLVTFRGKLYFAASIDNGNPDIATDAGRELWAYDAVTDTAARVADIAAGAASSSPNDLTALGPKLYFGANGGNGAGTELWSYDGLGAPVMVRDLNPGGSNGFGGNGTLAFNGKLYFAGADQDHSVAGITVPKAGFWSYDPALDRFTLGGLLPRSTIGIIGARPTLFNGKIYFGAHDPGIGFGLYAYNPANASPNLTRVPGTQFDLSPATDLALFDGALYITGTELFRYDGNTVQTARLPGNVAAANPADPTVFASRLYFGANGGDGFGSEVFSLDLAGLIRRESDINSDPAVSSGNAGPSGFIVYDPTISGPPDAVDDAATADRARVISVDPLLNDADPELGPLTITQINGAAISAGQTSTLPSGARVTVNANGTVTYDPNGAFNNLAPNATATDPFTYRLTDSDGTHDTATVTVTVTNRTLIVNTTASDDDGEIVIDISIREAINAANNETTHPGFDRIRLAAGATYAFTASLASRFGPTALPPVNSEILIEGNGARVARTGGPAFRLLAVEQFGNLTLDAITLSGGLASGFDGGAASRGGGGSAGLGGAVFNAGSLTIRNSTLVGNGAGGGSGGSGDNGVPGGAGGAGLGGHGGNPNGGGGAGGGGNTANGGFAGNTGGPGGGTIGGGAPGANGTDGGDGGAQGGAGNVGGGGGGDGSVNNESGNGGAGGTGGGGGGGGSRGINGGFGGAGGFGGGGGGAGLQAGRGGDGGFGGGAGASATPGSPLASPGVGGGSSPAGSLRGGGGAGLGGAVFNHGGTLVLIQSTFTQNSAQGGFGGFAGGAVAAGNGLGLGGALFNRNGSVTVVNSTFARNTADQGGGALYNLGDGPGGNASLTLRNSIVADSFTGADFAQSAVNGGATPNAGSHNVIESGSAAFGGTGTLTVDPGLDVLNNNGGPTATHAPLPGSIAIDRGDNAAAAGLTTDQRGATFPRLADSADFNAVDTVDLGAVELHPQIEDLSNRITEEDTPLTLSFEVGDADLISSVTATSNNATLLPAAALVMTGSGSLRTLNVTPAADKNGTATVFLTATSNTGSGRTFTESFTLTFNPVNDKPTFLITGDPPASLEEAGPQTVGEFTTNVRMGPPTATDEVSQTPAEYLLEITAVVFGNLAFSAGPTINAANRALTYTAAPNTSGIVTVTARLRDSGSGTFPHQKTSDPQTFNIRVDGTNDAPVVNDQAFAVSENSPAGTTVGTVAASDVDAGQTLAYAITAGNTAGAFAINSATGQLTVNNAAVLDFETTPVFSLTVQVTDNSSPALSDAATITINLSDVSDTPAPGTPDLIAADDFGSSNVDNVTRINAGLTFQVAAAQGQFVRLFRGGTLIASGVQTSASPILLDDVGSASEGANSYTATRAASSTAPQSPPSAPLIVTVDSFGPATPGIPDLDPGSDSGASNSDNVTNDNTPTFTGTSEAGSTLDLRSDGVIVASAVTAGGTFNFTTIALADGTQSITATVTDLAGNSSARSAGLPVTIDTLAPAAPSTPDLDPGSDTGASNTDNVTADNTPTFNGTAQPDSTVRVLSDGSPVGTAIVGAGGIYSITTTSLADGTRVITATATDAAGNVSVSGALSVTINTGGATVVDRHVFYNQSSFDGNSAAANAADDAAVAPDKNPLLPGGTATEANYTSYTRGINGVMVDIANLPAASLAAGNFQFRMGNDNNVAGWAAAPAPTAITVRDGAGVNGSDRVTITWADGAIAKTWLQVRVLNDANTGLGTADVFYFGNAPGDTFNSAAGAPFFVNAVDVQRTRLNQFQDAGSLAAAASLFDHNKSGSIINAQDLQLARLNQFTSLSRITVPAALVAAAGGNMNGVGRAATAHQIGLAPVASSALQGAWASLEQQ